MDEAKGPGTSDHCLVPLCVLSAVFRRASSGFFSKSAGFAFGTNSSSLSFRMNMSFSQGVFTQISADTLKVDCQETKSPQMLADHNTNTTKVLYSFSHTTLVADDLDDMHETQKARFRDVI